MPDMPFRGHLPFSEPPGHPDANRDWHSVATEWVWANYFHGLGYLMHSYSRVEANLNLLVSEFVKQQFREPWPRSYSQQENQTHASLVIKREALLQAVIVPMRPAAAKETLRRLLRVTEAETVIVDKVENILSHFSAIGGFRDLLAHNAPDHDCTNKNQNFILRNSFLVNEKSKEKTFSFPIELLVRAAFDLAHMPEFLNEILNPLNDDNAETNPGGGSIPNSWDEYGGWRCKPSELAPPQNSPAGRTPRQKRPKR